MNDEIGRRVKAVVSRQLEVPLEKVIGEASLVDDLQADSIAVIELVLALEEEFGLTILGTGAERIRTVTDTVNHIATLAP